MRVASSSVYVEDGQNVVGRIYRSGNIRHGSGYLEAEKLRLPTTDSVISPQRGTRMLLSNNFGLVVKYFVVLFSLFLSMKDNRSF